LPPDASIGQVLKLLDQSAGRVPISDEAGTVIGWARHRDVLTAVIAPEAARHQPAPRRQASESILAGAAGPL
jgi:hypothetical protein